MAIHARVEEAPATTSGCLELIWQFGQHLGDVLTMRLEALWVEPVGAVDALGLHVVALVFVILEQAFQENGL